MGANAATPRRQADDGDVVLVTAKLSDIAVDPFQGGNLIQKAPIAVIAGFGVRQAGMGQQAQDRPGDS